MVSSHAREQLHLPSLIRERKWRLNPERENTHCRLLLCINLKNEDLFYFLEYRILALSLLESIRVTKSCCIAYKIS